MDLFTVAVEVANPAGGEFVSLDALAGPGAHFTVLPASLLEGLGVVPDEEVEFTLPDGSQRTWGVGQARFRIGDRERMATVAFGDEGRSVLGTVALSEFALKPDAAKRQLAPLELFLVGNRIQGR